MLTLAGVVYWQAAIIPVSPIYAKVGPTVVPVITALALAVLGVLLLVAAWRGGWQSEEEQALTIDRVALAWIAAGLVLNVLLIGPAGFTLASIILFVRRAASARERSGATPRSPRYSRCSPISALPRPSASISVRVGRERDRRRPRPGPGV